MPTKKNFVIHILSGFLYAGSALWAFVEFALYLFKDDPFNFISLGLLIFSLLIGLTNMMYSIIKS